MTSGQRVRIILENGVELSARLESVAVTMEAGDCMRYDIRAVSYTRAELLAANYEPTRLVNPPSMAPQGLPRVPVHLPIPTAAPADAPKPAPAAPATRKRSFALSRQHKEEAKQRADTARRETLDRKIIEAASRNLQATGIMLFAPAPDIDDAINSARKEMPNALDSTVINIAVSREAITALHEKMAAALTGSSYSGSLPDGSMLYRGAKLWPLDSVDAKKIEKFMPDIYKTMLVFWIARIGEERVWTEEGQRFDWPALSACGQIMNQYRIHGQARP